MKKLGEIAYIRSGVFCKPDVDGGVRYLQSTDYDANRELIPRSANTTMVNGYDKSDKHILKPGEILFSSKGVNNYFAFFSGDTPYPCIASTIFFVITVMDKGVILPEFLCWYLNKPVIGNTIKASSMGSDIRSISKRTIEELEIAIPPMEKQRLIVETDGLMKEEIRLQNRIAQLRDQLLIDSLD